MAAAPKSVMQSCRVHNTGIASMLSGFESDANDVEVGLCEYIAVKECVVFAVPDEKWGETQKALVVLRSGPPISEEELINFCRERLTHFKCPKVVEFTELPKTSTGKVQKFLLRDKEWGGSERRIQ